MKKTILTGVKPTGMAHIGNYLGAIKPALEEVEKRKDGRFARKNSVMACLFIRLYLSDSF